MVFNLTHDQDGTGTLFLLVLFVSHHWDQGWDLLIPGPGNGTGRGRAIFPGNGTGPGVPQNPASDHSIRIVTITNDDQSNLLRWVQSPKIKINLKIDLKSTVRIFGSSIPMLHEPL